jgi:hypothetical protein
MFDVLRVSQLTRPFPVRELAGSIRISWLEEALPYPPVDPGLGHPVPRDAPVALAMPP